MDQVDTMACRNYQMVENMFLVNRKASSYKGFLFSLLGPGCERNWPTCDQHSIGNLSNKDFLSNGSQQQQQQQPPPQQPPPTTTTTTHQHHHPPAPPPAAPPPPAASSAGAQIVLGWCSFFFFLWSLWCSFCVFWHLSFPSFLGWLFLLQLFLRSPCVFCVCFSRFFALFCVCLCWFLAVVPKRQWSFLI